MTEKEWREQFSRKLYELLNEHNMSQRELSRATGISNASVSRYLSGFRTPNGYVISKICEYFNLPHDYFSTYTEG